MVNAVAESGTRIPCLWGGEYVQVFLQGNAAFGYGGLGCFFWVNRGRLFPKGFTRKLGLKPRPNAYGTATPRGRLCAKLRTEVRVINLSKNPVA